MGSTIGVGCQSCDYNKEFEIGIGMRYSPGNIMDYKSEFALLPDLIKSKKTLAIIMDLVENMNAVLSDGYGHGIYRCKKCDSLYERFYIHLEHDEGSYEIKYKCSKCKSNLTRIKRKKIDFTKYPCPKCMNYTLYENMFALWD